jgi:hypothetical protein
MSKGSSYWGTATGKIGNTVVRVRKGVRVESAYQPNVTNPRSSGQVVQRGKFADAVGFYKRSMANFFKMAFEDKKTNETDFNAFMRHNVSRGYVYSRQMVTGGQGALPYIGKWLLSFGSLFNLPISSGNSGLTVTLWLPGEGRDTATMGNMFARWITEGKAQEGDILTVVRILSSADGAGYDEYTDEALGLLPGFTYTETLPEGLAPIWSVDQYIIKSDSAGLIKEQRWITLPTDGDATINFADMGNASVDSARAAAAIITRKTANGLLCSTTPLVWNKKAEDMMTQMATDNWLEGQRKAWSSQNVILAGALV